jgi:potassium-transporting ATPase KdpC subunit
MLKHLRPAFSIVVLMTALTGIAYPLAITGVAQAIAPAKANGSLIIKNGDVIGSRLIGQSFNSDGYFWPRPSATASVPYNADASGGSNYGPTSANLRSRVTANITRLAGIGMRAPLPADAVMASGSGLDPDISPDFARAQISRVAKARGIEQSDLDRLVETHTSQRWLGFIGEPRVNVLELNLALDTLKT